MGKAERFMGRLTTEALRTAMFTEIIHTQHLATTRKHLKEGGRAIAVGNHISANDPVAHSRPLAETTTSDHMTFIGSRRHFDSRRGRFNAVKSVLGEWWQEAYGIDIALVTQTKDRPTYPDWATHDAQTMERLKVAVKTPGQLVYILPEGERSNTGGLLQAEEGVSRLLAEGGDDVLVLPITEDYTDLSFLKGRAKLTIGEPFFRPRIMTERAAINQRIKDLREQGKRIPFAGVADVIMMHIAHPLPPQNHGYYAPLMQIGQDLITA